MQDRYAATFRSLSREQAFRVRDVLVRERVIPWNPVPTDGSSLLTCLQMHGVDQARVIFAMGREYDALGVSAIEHIIGKAIVRRRPPESLAPGRAGPSRPPPSRAEDQHVVRSVAPNPKKAGSATYDRYKHWEVGVTVAECMRRGLTRADVSWDVERGFVVVGAP